MSKTIVVPCRDAQQALSMMTVRSTALNAVQWHTNKRTQEMGTKKDIELVSSIGLKMWS